jgi:hypothetical protein
MPLRRQAFIREKAIADANRPMSSPTFGSFPHSIPYRQQPFGVAFGDESILGQSESKLEKVRAHTRRFSAKFCNYSPIYMDESVGNAVLLKRQSLERDGASCGEEKFEDQIVREHGDWIERDSVTLGGSEREGSEKDGSVFVRG